MKRGPYHRPDYRLEAREILDWPDQDVQRLAALTADLMEAGRSRAEASRAAYLEVRRTRKNQS